MQNERPVVNPKDRPLSDPPDNINPIHIKIRLAGGLVHETVFANHIPIPQKGDFIRIPDQSGRYGIVEYKIYDLHQDSMTITIMLKTSP